MADIIVRQLLPEFARTLGASSAEGSHVAAASANRRTLQCDAGPSCGVHGPAALGEAFTRARRSARRAIALDETRASSTLAGAFSLSPDSTRAMGHGAHCWVPCAAALPAVSACGRASGVHRTAPVRPKRQSRRPAQRCRPRPVGAPSLLVHLSSERLVEPVRQDSPLPRSRCLTRRTCSSSGAGAPRNGARSLASGATARAGGAVPPSRQCRPPSRSPGPGGLRCPGHARRHRVTATTRRDPGCLMACRCPRPP
jgi:hypothetical protein